MKILNLFVPDIAKTVEGRELAKCSGKPSSEILDMVTRFMVEVTERQKRIREEEDRKT